MKIVLYISTAHTENGQPSPWLKARLDAAINYYQSHNQDECIFLPSGRWPNAYDSPAVTEAEVCKRYILGKLPKAKVIKEDICVETAGGFAFSKPIIDLLRPDKVVIFNSLVNGERVKFFVAKIFGPNYNCEFVLLDDGLSRNPKARDKEPRALVMYKKLFEEVKDGSDAQVRDILLYRTPFYFKGFINTEQFFNEYWPGGFANKELTEDSKQGK